MARLPVLLTLLLVLVARGDDALDQRVRALVRQLGSESSDEREAAQKGLASLGASARTPVEAERKGATDPEVAARLDSVLEGYLLQEEEAWTLARLREGRPFPKGSSPDAELNVQDRVGASDVLALISKITGIPIEPFPGDRELAEHLAETRVSFSYHGDASDSGRSLLGSTLMPLDATWVVDGGRVVIVRMTAPVLLAKIQEEGLRVTGYDSEEALEAYRSRPSFWGGAREWVQKRSEASQPVRDAWLKILRDCALDAKRSAADRSAALVGLREFLVRGTPQPDVDEVFLAVLAEGSSPSEVRAFALRGLAMCLSEPAQDVLLDLLEKGDAASQRELLETLMETWPFTDAAMPRIRGDAARGKRYEGALRCLSGSADAGVSTAALCLRTHDKDLDATRALAGRGRPADSRLRFLLMDTLYRSEEETTRARFWTFEKDPDGETRALFLTICCGRAGGAHRTDDLSAAMRLLDDPDPSVRFFAARGIGIAWSKNSAEPCKELGEECLKRLEERSSTEKDPRVREQLRIAIEGSILK